MVMPLMAKYTFHVSAARLSGPMACSAIGSLVGGVVVEPPAALIEAINRSNARIARLFGRPVAA